jgi:hypothetical protein
MHCLANLVEDALRRPDPHSLDHLRSHLLRDQAENLQIRFGAHHLNCGLQLLDLAANVGDGAGLFVRRCGRENDIGALGGFSHEQILNYDESAF